MKLMLRIFSVGCLMLVLQALAAGQAAATGELHVTVKDPSGKVVTNATVSVADEAKAFERSTSQNTDGEYRFLALPPGRYTITIVAQGFGKAVVKDQGITVGQMADVPVTVQVSGGETVVTVSSEAELVETSRSTSTDTVDQLRIDSLPINGRNYINFTLTDSQVVRDNAPSIGAAPTSGLNMSGQRGRSNLVNVDGADAIDNSVNGVRSTVSQEAVQEFQILTNGYTAEYGRASGGVVNIITRSGSNEFHGDVFGYLRNRNFQAVNPFSNVSNPAYTRVQSGAAFGGPIKRDKTYYFFSYEVTRRHETGFSSIGRDGFGLVPTDGSVGFGAPPGSGFEILATPPQAQFIQGLPNTLANLPAQLAALGVPASAITAIVTAYGQEGAIYTGFVGAASGIAVNGAYPTSFASLPSPLLQGALAPAGLRQFITSCNGVVSVPVCNGLPGNFLNLASQVGNFPVFEGTSLYSLRLDHNLNTRNRLMLRGSASPSTVTGIEVNGENQTFGENAYSRTSVQTYRDAGGQVQDTWTVGNNKINEFRFQYARRGLLYNFSNSPGGGDLAVSIPGEAFFGREPYSYIKRVEQRFQVTDNFSWSLGHHDVKFGGDFNYLPVTADFTVNYGGQISFGFNDLSNLFPNPCTVALGTPGPCPNFPAVFTPVQSYGLGLPSTFVQGYGNPHDSFSNKPLGIFLQDSWKMRSKLTLNLGVRYDVEFVPHFASPDTLALAAYNRLGIQKGIQTDTNNVAPRIGVAWDPKGDGKSVIRASYGMFYDHPLLGLFFLGDASDGSKTGQLLFFGTGTCTGGGNPGNLNAVPIFQGNLLTPQCLPGPNGIQNALGYLPSEQRFDAFNANLFINQNFLTAGIPLGFLPFGYPQAKNFVYAYSHQANLTFERDLGNGFALSLAYNFNGGRHLNRPINANAPRGDLLVKNWQAAYTDPASLAALGGPSVGPLLVGSGAAPCGVNNGQPWISAALMNFFRPSGLNPSLANVLLTQGGAGGALCVGLAQQILSGLVSQGFNASCNPMPPFDGCVPFSDMAANFSNGSSVYHGLTANLRKRFNNHYEFLASYTWSHAIDDSTDLQSPLVPQDSYYPGLERSNSLFDQRHRFVFSGVYQTGQLSGTGFWSRLTSDWTFAPIVEISSGRPFNILAGSIPNLQFESSARPSAVPANSPTLGCGAAVASKYSPTGFLQLPCPSPTTPDVTLLSLDGTLGRNAGTRPYTVFNDLRIARRIRLGEHASLDGIVDIFNIANRFNVADVSPLFTSAGQATAAYDPRQLQFALKLNW